MILFLFSYFPSSVAPKRLSCFSPLQRPGCCGVAAVRARCWLRVEAASTPRSASTLSFPRRAFADQPSGFHPIVAWRGAGEALVQQFAANLVGLIVAKPFFHRGVNRQFQGTGAGLIRKARPRLHDEDAKQIDFRRCDRDWGKPVPVAQATRAKRALMLRPGKSMSVDAMRA